VAVSGRVPPGARPRDRSEVAIAGRSAGSPGRPRRSYGAPGWGSSGPRSPRARYGRVPSRGASGG
jgi:hypothetical protein